MDVGSIRPSGGAGGFETPPVDAASRRPPPSDATAQASETEQDPEVRTVADLQKLVSFVKNAAEIIVAAEEPDTEDVGTKGDGGGNSGPYDQGVPKMVLQVEKHAEKIFRSIIEYAGDDRKLLENARGMVSRVFGEYQANDPPPLMAMMTRDRVLDLIEQRLREMQSVKDVDFSA